VANLHRVSEKKDATCNFTIIFADINVKLNIYFSQTRAATDLTEMVGFNSDFIAGP